MFYENIADVIGERNIICVSPHYDDFLFFLGGYFFELREQGLLDTKKVTNVSVFSRTNYQERDDEGNRDRSRKRVQYATGIRFIEDLECLDAMLGSRNYRYCVLGENESLVRGGDLDGGGDMEMTVGCLESMTAEEHDICGRIFDFISEISQKEDTAIVLPLSMKGHIDHFTVLHAGERVLEAGEAKAEFYFAEDKPYAGLLSEDENAVTGSLIAKWKLEDRAFRHHPQKVLEYAYKYYPSQIDDVYDAGINSRNEQLKEIYSVSCDTDRIFKYNK